MAPKGWCSLTFYTSSPKTTQDSFKFVSAGPSERHPVECRRPPKRGHVLSSEPSPRQHVFVSLGRLVSQHVPVCIHTHTLTAAVHRAVACLARAVGQGGASGLGGVVLVRTGQAGAGPPRDPLRFVRAGWTGWPKIKTDNLTNHQPRSRGNQSINPNQPNADPGAGRTGQSNRISQTLIKEQA